MLGIRLRTKEKKRNRTQWWWRSKRMKMADRSRQGLQLQRIEERWTKRANRVLAGDSEERGRKR